MSLSEAELWSGVSVYVLAGGRSSRMGTDKAFVRVDGAELIERAVREFEGKCERVAILCGPPNTQLEALLDCYAPVVPDSTGEHQGPVAGLLAAMQNATTPLVVLLAVDQPGVSSIAIELLLKAAYDDGAAAACFVSEGRPEPLPLVIRRELAPQVARLAAAGERRLMRVVLHAAEAAGSAVSAVECLELPAGTLRLGNLNTPDDVRQWHEESCASNHSAAAASE